ncbi:MAG: tripartite tricarboxylate transporter permease [Rhodospirillales bacterium]|nr:tripartite tricarboxylate transporter permease [Rhodospirillales bacterium]
MIDWAVLGDSLSLIMTWQVLAACFAGVVWGMFVGVTPGLTGIMAVVIALPMTFFMEAETSIALLLGIYVTAIYGGSVTAIMIATPGTPNAAATLLDGYPLAQKGKTRQALEMALYASLTAGILSTVIAMTVFPVVASIALDFGAPEVFAVIVFSITIIAGVSGDSILKGLIAACFGFLIAMIGQDPIHGSSRFTFGIPDFQAGMHILTILVGLFTIPEVIARAVEAFKSKEKITVGEMGPALTFKQYLSYWPTYARSTLGGSLLGALPGLGGSPAAFLGYFLAKRFSKTPREFGKGTLEGVAGAEAGNNAVCGPALVPMMSLGIPGDTTTAVLMGALVIHGLSPGPLLFDNEPVFVYGVFLLLFVSLIFLGIVGTGVIRVAKWVVRIPTSIMFPVVLILATYGTYAVRSTMVDVIAMVGVGILGYLMRTQKIPAAPFAIAFILGPLLENELRKSLIISSGSLDIFFQSGISITFLILALVSAVLTVYLHWRLEGSDAARMIRD